MFRKASNWPTRGTPVVEHMLISQPVEYQSTEGKGMRRRSIAVIIATYRYLSEGVRILGQTYSIYDDRSDARHRASQGVEAPPNSFFP